MADFPPLLPLALHGPRFLAPAGRPTVVAGDAATAAKGAGIPLRLDRIAALGFLRDTEYDARRTLFEGIELAEALAPLSTGADGIVVAGVPPRGPGRAMLGTVPATSANALRAALGAAIEDALRSARRPAVALTGGLDSSAVAASAAAEWRALGRAPADLRAYHLLPTAGPTEVEHARAVAKHVGMELVEVQAPDGDPFDGPAAEALLAANDFPSDGGGPGPWAHLGERLRQDGVDVLLTGDGGDEAVIEFRSQEREGLIWVASKLKAAGRHVFPRYWIRGHMPAWLGDQVGPVPATHPAPAPREGLQGAAAARDGALRSARTLGTVGWWRAFDLVYGTRTETPFLDVRVADAVLAAPEGHMAVEPRPKGILRLAFRDLLPPVERDRPKDQPFCEPLFRRDFERFGDAWIEKYVRVGALARDGLVPVDGAAVEFRCAVRGTDADLPLPLAIVGLGAWCRARGL